MPSLQPKQRMFRCAECKSVWMVSDASRALLPPVHYEKHTEDCQSRPRVGYVDVE